MSQHNKPKSARPAGAALAAKASASQNPESVPPLLWAIMGLTMACLLSIMLAMTSMTYNLDDIKVPLLFGFGPMLMLLASGLIYLGQGPLPPKTAAWGLLGFGVVMILSTLASDYKSLGWYQIMFIWSVAGFFFAALCIGANYASARIFFRFIVLLTLLLNLIGFFFYDLTGSPDHRSGVAWLFRFIYGAHQPADITGLYNLLYTLLNADNDLQSTILNRDFYAGLSVMFLPFCLALAIDPLGGPRANLWRGIGMAATLLDALTVFFCKSKGEWIFVVVSMAFFAVMFFRVGVMADFRRRHVLAWVGGLLGLILLIMWLQSPTLGSQLKWLPSSFKSRSIMWVGAWEIWKEYPILGSGPGGFRIYFPEFRAPDYYNHGINNVTTYSHNLFLDILCEEGALGLICYLLFIGTMLFLATRYALRHENPRLRLWLTAGAAALIGIYGSNLSSPNARWVIGATPLWTIMGFVTGIICQARGWQAELNPLTHETPAGLAVRGPQRWTAATMAAVGAILICFTVPTGVNYFRGAQQYAEGLQYMEWAQRQYESAQGDPAPLTAHFDEAARFFESALKLDPANSSAYYKVGSVYTSLYQLNADISQNLQQQGNPDSAEHHYQLAIANLNKAKEKYEKLMTIDPDYSEIHYNMGIVYEAYADYLRAAVSQPGVPPTEKAGSEKLAAEYEQKAVKHLTRIGQLSAKPEVYKLRGRYLIKLKQMEQARDIFRDGSKAYPDNNELAVYYFQTAYKVADYAGACAALYRLWEKAPADEQVLDQLYALASEHKQVDYLEKIAQRLEAINPIHPRLYEAQMALARQREQKSDVVSALRRYIQCGGQDLELYQIGAEAAQHLGRPEEAREIYQLILKVDRDGRTTYSTEAQKRLAGPVAAAPAPQPAGAAGASSDSLTSQSKIQSNKAGAPAPSPSAG